MGPSPRLNKKRPASVSQRAMRSSRRRTSEEPAESRCEKLRKSLDELDAMLQEIDKDAAPPVSSGTAATAKPEKDGSRTMSVSVAIGTSELCQDRAMVERIMTMVNTAYYESIKDILNPRVKSYERLSLDEVVDRLRMGDAGLRANRVLHIAFTGSAPTPDTVVGCMSSTFQPPWTEEGCGHWGLLVVDTAFQGRGIATQLIAAAELRLAGTCHEIQVEYEYTPGHGYSERLMDWYEGKCGFKCATGYRRGAGTQFRKCRKKIPPEEAKRGRASRLRALRDEVAAELAAIETTTERVATADGQAGHAVLESDSEIHSASSSP